jgi:hypothetical protein
MVARNIRTSLNYKDRVKDEQFEILENTVSLTEENASISPREIMYRYTSGNLPEIRREDTGEDDPLTFDDYDHYHDPDYELSDLTRDRIALFKKKDEVEKSLARKRELRREKDLREKEEFDNWKKLKEEAEKRTVAPENA